MFEAIFKKPQRTKTDKESHSEAQRKYRLKNKEVVMAKEMVNKCVSQAKKLNLDFDAAKNKFLELSSRILHEYTLETPITSEDIYIQVASNILIKIVTAKYDFPYIDAGLFVYNEIYGRNEDYLPFHMNGGPVDTLLQSRSRFNRKLTLYYLCMVETYTPRSITK